MEVEPLNHETADQALGWESREPDGGEMNSTEASVTFVEVDEVDPHSDDRFLVGDLGTLSGRLGPEKAEAVASQSLTRFTRVNAARRLGSLILQ